MLILFFFGTYGVIVACLWKFWHDMEFGTCSSLGNMADRAGNG